MQEYPFYKGYAEGTLQEVHVELEPAQVLHIREQLALA